MRERETIVLPFIKDSDMTEISLLTVCSILILSLSQVTFDSASNIYKTYLIREDSS